MTYTPNSKPSPSRTYTNEEIARIKRYIEPQLPDLLNGLKEQEEAQRVRRSTLDLQFLPLKR